MRIAIFGIGAMGSVYAGLMAEAGHEVSLIARGPHLAAIRENGLKL